MHRLWVERRKFPDAPHYGHEGWLLGEDQHGWWIGLRPGNPIYRGDELLFHGTGGGVLVVPDQRGWMAWFPEHGPFDLYVDIVTPPVRTRETITMIDLDLDVVRHRDGTVEVLDEDEFAHHQVALGYSAEMIAAARAAADEVHAAVVAGHEPFAGAAAAEWARTSSRSPIR